MAYASHLSGTQDDVDPAFGVNDVADLAYLESICGVFKGLLHLPPAKGTYQGLQDNDQNDASIDHEEVW